MNKKTTGRKVHFNTPESADDQFWIKRPDYRWNIVDHNVKLPKNQRNGLGNRDITRVNFMSSSIKPRFVGDFAQLQALDISEIGKPGSVTDKLEYSTQIKVPDPTDFEWLREKARLEAEYIARFTLAGFPGDEIPAMVARELEINKPLGRPQRTTNKSSDDIANETRLDTAGKIREIIQEIREGRAENRESRVAISAQIIRIFEDTQAINALTQTQLQGLGLALARIGIPTTHKSLGLIPRFVDIAYYNENSGMINLLIFSKVKESANSDLYNYDKMVLDFVANAETGLPAIKLTSLVSSMGSRGRGRRYLDLERVGRISREQLRYFARIDPFGGFDGENFSIQPGNR